MKQRQNKIIVSSDGMNEQIAKFNTAELQWHEGPWNHENIFETGVVRAKECKIKAPGQEA